MSKVKSAAIGVLSSAVIAGGAWAGETVSKDKEQKAIQACYQLGESAVKPCVQEAKDLNHPGDGFELLELAGVIGVIGCGYLGYKSLKEEAGTTGILEDHL
jgi:hypothetical protein